MTKTHRFAAGAAAALAALALAAPALADGFSIRFGYAKGPGGSRVHVGGAWYGGGWYGGAGSYSYSRWSPVVYRDWNPRVVVRSAWPLDYWRCRPRPVVAYGGTYVPRSTYVSIGARYPRVLTNRYVARQREYRTYRYPTYRYKRSPAPRLHSYITPKRQHSDRYDSRYSGRYDRLRSGRYDTHYRAPSYDRGSRYRAVPRSHGHSRYGDRHRSHSYGRTFRR